MTDENDDTKTLRISIDHPPGRGSRREIEVPADTTSSEAWEWAKDVFYEACSFHVENLDDFAENTDE